MLLTGYYYHPIYQTIQIIIYNVSYGWALYCLYVFYLAVKKVISPFRPIAKFATVKSIIFATYYQTLLLQYLLSRQETYWLWNDFLLSLEMVIFAIACIIAFPTKEFIGGIPSPNLCSNLAEVLSIHDVYMNLYHNFRPEYRDYALQRSENEVPTSIQHVVDIDNYMHGNMNSVAVEMTRRYRGYNSKRNLNSVLRGPNMISAKIRRSNIGMKPSSSSNGEWIANELDASTSSTMDQKVSERGIRRNSIRDSVHNRIIDEGSDDNDEMNDECKERSNGREGIDMDVSMNEDSEKRQRRDSLSLSSSSTDGGNKMSPRISPSSSSQPSRSSSHSSFIGDQDNGSSSIVNPMILTDDSNSVNTGHTSLPIGRLSLSFKANTTINSQGVNQIKGSLKPKSPVARAGGASTSEDLATIGGSDSIRPYSHKKRVQELLQEEKVDDSDEEHSKVKSDIVRQSQSKPMGKSLSSAGATSGSTVSSAHGAQYRDIQRRSPDALLSSSHGSSTSLAALASSTAATVVVPEAHTARPSSGPRRGLLQQAIMSLSPPPKQPKRSSASPTNDMMGQTPPASTEKLVKRGHSPFSGSRSKQDIQHRGLLQGDSNHGHDVDLEWGEFI